MSNPNKPSQPASHGRNPRKKEMSVTNQINSGLCEILSKHEAKLIAEWFKEQSAISSHGGALPKESELRAECAEFIGVLRKAVAAEADGKIDSPVYSDVREMLDHLSRTRTVRGCTPSETASFVFSLKGPLFKFLRSEVNGDGQALADEIWATNVLLDKLGLYTIEVYQKTREEIINRQQAEMLELSTPVVKLWDGILGLPMIGTLDSARTQIVMESLLQKIVETGSVIAIIDITGVPTVDTLTAQHLLKTVTAARLMGAECIISGIRPQIAQTIVHLGVDLGDVITKATLADALGVALGKTGRTITRVKIRKGPGS
jgi:rsbT co-antagonist protein RsbR